MKHRMRGWLRMMNWQESVRNGADPFWNTIPEFTCGTVQETPQTCLDSRPSDENLKDSVEIRRLAISSPRRTVFSVVSVAINRNISSILTKYEFNGSASESAVLPISISGSEPFLGKGIWENIGQLNVEKINVLCVIVAYETPQTRYIGTQLMVAGWHYSPIHFSFSNI
jgi:hypothetical protein